MNNIQEVDMAMKLGVSYHIQLFLQFHKILTIYNLIMLIWL